jgi:transposase
VKKELADVVLVDRRDIEAYREKLEKHKQTIDGLTSKLEHKTMEVKNKLEEEKKKSEDVLRKESELWAQRYKQLEFEKQKVDSEKTNLIKVASGLIAGQRRKPSQSRRGP